MKIDKQNSFDAPEGFHRMKIVNCDLGLDKYGRERLRMLGDLISLKSRTQNIQAGVNYGEGSMDLLPDLYKILGGDVVKVIGENGEVLRDGLAILRDKECDVQIAHIHNPKHVKPYCHVARLEAAGVLIKFPSS